MKLDLLDDAIPVVAGIGSNNPRENPIALNGTPGERRETCNLASVLQAASSQVTGEQLSGRAINEARDRTV